MKSISAAETSPFDGCAEPSALLNAEEPFADALPSAFADAALPCCRLLAALPPAICFASGVPCRGRSTASDWIKDRLLRKTILRKTCHGQGFLDALSASELASQHSGHSRPHARRVGHLTGGDLKI